MIEHLNRAAAPFSDELWQRIDAIAVEAARDRLTGRRFLPVKGPYGVGFTAMEVGPDDYVRPHSADEAGVVAGRALPVAMLHQSFQLSIRRVVAHESGGQPFDLNAVEDAADAVARREEELIYQGLKEVGQAGLLAGPGVLKQDGGDWGDLDQVIGDVLAAITRLDQAGFPGPYALVLAPALYNGLFRRYAHTEMLQVQHLGRICQRGLYKAAVKGAAVIDPRAATLLLGSDLRAGYVGQDGVHHQLYLRESLLLQVNDADAVCVIGAKG